jgi:hypothetical protein
MKGPFKIYNAGSFKIPTIGYPEAGYELNAKGMYFEARTIDEIVDLCVELKENSIMYRDMAETAHRFAQNYHIDKIIPLYKVLE